MIGISKLFCGTVEASDPLRYGRKAKDLPSHLLQFSEDKKPIVVWNCTRRCNLACVHCYSQSADKHYENELTTDEGLVLLDDLGRFGAPVVLFSGGEPLLREDLITLIERAKNNQMRAVISTNGTMIDQEKADCFAQIGLSYAGISLDDTVKKILEAGIQCISISIDGATAVSHNAFRRVEGAFEGAIADRF